jgi:ribonuclease G
MAKEMIISSNGFERKIAILEDGVLTEYYVERMGEAEVLVGNIYKGRVTKVLPGMQSAFIDIGLERDAFLYVADVFEGESEEIEYEEPPVKRETKPAPARASRAAAKSPAPEPALVSEEEAQEIIDAIAEARTAPPMLPEEETLEEAEAVGFDERAADFLERFSEDLAGATADAESAEAEAEAAMDLTDFKDAFVEEKIIEAVHREEMQMQMEPATRSEVRVGSLQIAFSRDSGLERIVDEPLTEPPPDEPAAMAATVQSKAVEAEAVINEPSPSAERITDEEVSEPAQAAASDEEPPLDDAEASVQTRVPRAEFAARRRLRRRRQERPPRAPEVEEDEPRAEDGPPSPTITELLKEGQEIIVQIAKEPIGNKGARVTSHIALPGRYLVYMPTVDHVGVSRRIGALSDRIRLRKLMTALRNQEKARGGFIVRTAAEATSEAEVHTDMRYLVRTWEDIRRRADRQKAPCLLSHELDLVQRILRDRLSSDFTAIRVDNEDDYTQIIDFADHFQPDLLKRVKLHTRETPIFEQYGVQSEIDKAIRPRVWLKSGGYIVINQTEALVAIDVNTGKFVGKTNRFEDTITRTNMEAAKEIARQIRLRDLGGIIVLDFIDMEERRNRQKVMQVLEEELRKDRAPAKVLQFNDFGLVAITRKRVRQSLERILCEPCPYCHGSGMVKSPQTISCEILDEVRRIAKDIEKGTEVIVRVHPEVAKALRDKQVNVMETIESYLKGNVTLKADPLLHQEQFDIALV